MGRRRRALRSELPLPERSCSCVPDVQLAGVVYADLLPEVPTRMLLDDSASHHIQGELRVHSAPYDLVAEHGYDLDPVYDDDSVWLDFSTDKPDAEAGSVVVRWRQHSADRQCLGEHNFADRSSQVQYSRYLQLRGSCWRIRVVDEAVGRRRRRGRVSCNSN